MYITDQCIGAEPGSIEHYSQYYNDIESVLTKTQNYIEYSMYLEYCKDMIIILA